MSHSNDGATPQETYLAQRAAAGNLTREEQNAAAKLGIVKSSTFRQVIKEIGIQQVTGRTPEPELTEKGRAILRGDYTREPRDHQR